MASKKVKEPTLSMEEYFEIAQYRVDDFLVMLKRATFKTTKDDVLKEFNVEFNLVDLFDDEEWEEISDISPTATKELEKLFSEFLFETFANISIVKKEPTTYLIQVTESEE